MNGAKRQFMVLIHDFGAGVDEGFLTDVVLQDVPEHIDCHTLYTSAHRHHAQVGGL
jgi:hypothetical protein